MRETWSQLKAVSDEKLLRGLFSALKQTRHDEADLIAHIAEVDARKLYAREAAPSMFAWCTETLHLSESEAYLRIAVARASRRHPMLLGMLADGRLHLSGIERLAPHLTERNRDALLKRAAHRSKRQIEELVAETAPRPAAAATMRKLPTRRGLDATGSLVARSEPRPDGVAAPGPGSDGGGYSVGGQHPAREQRPDGAVGPPISGPKPARAPEAIAPARFRLQFDLDAEFRDELQRLQALMRTAVPDGDLGKVIRLAVTRELARLEARRFAKTKKPRKRLGQTDMRPKSRYIPAAVRRFVHRRDGGRCTYRDTHGRRCTRRHDLEFHHRKAFGLGGDHSPEGLALMCRAHNALLAERDFGKEKMAQHRRRASRDTTPASVIGPGRASDAFSAEWRSPG
jgi:hypothetical protein